MWEEISHGFLASKQKWRLLQNLQGRWIKCKISCRRVRAITWKLENEGKTDILLTCMKDQQRMQAIVSLKLVSYPIRSKQSRETSETSRLQSALDNHSQTLKVFFLESSPNCWTKIKLDVVCTSRFLLNSNTVRFHGFGYIDQTPPCNKSGWRRKQHHVYLFSKLFANSVIGESTFLEEKSNEFLLEVKSDSR